MEIRRPRFDRRGQRRTARRECSEIAANTKQSSACGYQHRSNIVALAQFSHAKAELAAKVPVDRVTTVGLTECYMRESAIDRAFKALCCDCQAHRVFPGLFGLFEIKFQAAATYRFSDRSCGAGVT